MIVIIAYDITDDRRREDVAMLLSGYGPRVQLSVFECDVQSAESSDGTDQLQDAQNRPGPRNPISAGQGTSPGAEVPNGDRLRSLLDPVLATATIAAGQPPRKRRAVAKPRPIKRA
jgi:CRISPR associated protein Cas2